MATVVLQVAGTVIGGALGGPVGAAVGRAIGAAAGFAIDRQLFGPGDRAIEGPRLKNAQFLSSEEGTPISRIYGRSRISGQIIWSTRFEEVQQTESQSQGGKGGPKTTVTSYSYFANFAIGLCEGEVACLRRIWADGKLLDQSDLIIRLHKGNQDQQPDSLIEAKQGSGNAPAYRGLAYVVFERLPLENFGNRIPQIAVEIIKPVGQLEKRLKAISLLPGASEFIYDPRPVSEKTDAITVTSLNRHNTIAGSDWAASMDELQALCPNLTGVALISSWFGDDLRAGHCTCAPRVEVVTRNLQEGEAWQVSGIARGAAQLVSYIDGKPAYGGTPSDGGIIRAIQDAHLRGLNVTFYPFMMMDIADGNMLPNPYGGSTQSVYPWRGRITCHPASGEPSSADGTTQATSQISAFVGTAQPADFADGNNTITYNGPAEWSYRRLILHYAKLCALAGGVDAFLIGSELRGLTHVRDDVGNFPFVDQLKTLAADVRTILGASTKISYAADWSEYFGYQPADGSSDVHYNLDPLWADSNIDMVAIDNYMPASDWRDDGAPDGQGTSARDGDAMAANIANGEGFDWYYASVNDRVNGVRTPITDGLGKPWIFRYKDIRSWWQNDHFPRSGGIEAPTSTAWQPQMKPIWFTELGCPAVDKGANQPNVFVDPKSSESMVPYFSNGGRDDAVQASFIEAHQRHWDSSHPEFVDANNPQASVYFGRMVDADNAHLWAWDVRPWPHFPHNETLWSDGGNWRLGHWLNGRLGTARLADLIAAILEDYGFSEFDVSAVHGQTDGYVLSGITSPRGALQALVDLYQVQVIENGNQLVFRTPDQRTATLLSRQDLAGNKDEPLVTVKRMQETELPRRAILEHADQELEYQPTATYSHRIEGESDRQVTLSAPLILPRDLAVPLIDDWLRAAWIGRSSLKINLSRRYQHLQVGDQIELDDDNLAGKWLITGIEENSQLSLDLRSIEHVSTAAVAYGGRQTSLVPGGASGLAMAHLLDLPVFSDGEAAQASRVAVASHPWPGPHAVYSAPDLDNFSYRQEISLRATIGELTLPLSPGLVGLFDAGNEIEVRLYTGTLSSQPTLQVFNGSNAAAIRCQNGGWEIVQFADAELISDSTWRLTKLLRGQLGTEQEMAAGAASGADFVLLNQAVEPLGYEYFEVGLPLNWIVGPKAAAIADTNNASTQFAPGMRGYLPLSPVHLSMMISPTLDAGFDWIRRDRLNADTWSAGEIPMSEAEERYQVVVKSGQSILRQWSVTSPEHVYTRTEQLADIGSFPASLVIEVAQVSASHGPGAVASLSFSLE